MATIDGIKNRSLDFLLLMEDYHGAYTEFLAKNTWIGFLSYEEMAKRLFLEFIYYGDSYKHALALEGFSAEQIIPDCRSLQLKWAIENNIFLPPSWLSKRPFCWWWTRILGVSSPSAWDNVRFSIVTEQIKKLRPKMLWVFSGSMPLTSEILTKWRCYTEKIILWWACPLRQGFPYNSFDLIISSIPFLIKHFRKQGINAKYLPHSFDPRICQYFSSAAERIKKVVFVGSLSPDHEQRVVLLDYLSKHISIDFYGNASDKIALQLNYRGNAWGRDLYAVYNSYLITIHKNIDVAKNEISAKRLFEATGMGICVVAEAADELSRFFEPEKEIITYSTPKECIDKIRHLLANPQEAQEIGARGQKRTLQLHTYAHNIKQLIDHLKEFKLL